MVPIPSPTASPSAESDRLDLMEERHRRDTSARSERVCTSKINQPADPCCRNLPLPGPVTQLGGGIRDPFIKKQSKCLIFVDSLIRRARVWREFGGGLQKTSLFYVNGGKCVNFQGLSPTFCLAGFTWACLASLAFFMSSGVSLVTTVSWTDLLW